MVRTLTSHQCGPGSYPGVEAICGLSLLLVPLVPAPRGFSPGAPVFFSPEKTTFQIPTRSGVSPISLNAFYFRARSRCYFPIPNI